MLMVKPGLKNPIQKPSLPWLAWLCGLTAGLRTKESPVRFPVRAQAWVVGQVPSRGCARGYLTLMFLSLSFSLPSPSLKKLSLLKKLPTL